MKRKALCLLLILFLVESSALQEARADWNYTFIPSASLGLEYDSNIFFKSSDEESDMNYRGNVTFPFNAVSETTQIGINYRTNRFQYDSRTDANYGNHFFNLNASHSMTRRLNLSLTDRYSVTKSADRILESQNEEGELGIIEERNRRRLNAVTGSIKYSLSSKVFLSLRATNSFNRYSFANNYDSTTNGGAVSLNYSLSPQNTFFITSNFSKGDYERSDRQLTENAVYRSITPTFYELLFNSEFDSSENYSAYLGWTHRISSTLEFTLYAGSRKTKDTTDILSLVSGAGNIEVPHSLTNGSLVTFTVGSTPGFDTALTGAPIVIPNASFATTNASRKNSGAIYNFNIKKTFQSSSLSFTIGQDISERPAQGGTSVRQTYRANYTHNLSDRLRFFLNGSFYKNENETGTFDDKYKTFRAGTGFRFAVTRKLNSSLSWNHTEQKRDLQGAVSENKTKRDLVSLLFTYRWPIER